MTGSKLMATTWLLLCGTASPAMARDAAPIRESAQAGQSQANPPRPTDPAAAVDKGPVGIDDIIVTAEKREDSLQHVPVAINAVTGNALKEAGINSLLDIVRLAPEVRITRVGPGSSIQLRGVFTSDGTAEPPNAIAIDGAPIQRSTAFTGLLYDLQRIEILKGPQGTLYGRNSSGGAINFITNKPVFRAEGSGELEFGNYNTLRATGVVNVPIGAKLAVRAAFQFYSHDGYYKSGLDDADERSGRIELLWKPTDRDSLLVTGDLELVGGRGSGVQTIIGRFLGPQGGNNKGIAFVIATDLRDDRASYGEVNPYTFSSRNRGFMVQADHDFDFATLTVQFADRLFKLEPISPANFLNADYASVPGTGPAGGTTTSPNAPFFNAALPYGGRSYVPSSIHSDAVEVRLTSRDKTPLQWVIGVNGLWSLNNDVSNQYPTQTSLIPSTIVQNQHNITHSQAVFGQATWTPAGLDRLHLTAGIRYTADQKSAVLATYIGNGITAPVLQTPGIQNLSNAWHAVTTRFAVDYNITNAIMIYASRATGYKAGGFAFGSSPIYNPEHNTAYEAGLKSRFFDNRLQLNIGAYTYHYTDFEQVISYAIGNTTSRMNTVANAGEANMRGFEVDLQVLPTSHDKISISVAAENAKYGVNIPPIPPYSATGTTPATTNTLPLDLSNTHIPGVADYSGRASYQHSFDLAGGTLDFMASTDFRGKTLLSAANTNYPNATFPTAAPAFYFYARPSAMFDASVRYTSRGGTWTLTGYIRNIANKIVYQSATVNGSVGLIGATLFAPRTFGGILSIRF
ncbi:MAG: hypothetical protein JWR80_8313 [Bradyrhizobium sp.]|nr:hypothetical protein [Bradyrhizobium sp.]